MGGRCVRLVLWRMDNALKSVNNVSVIKTTYMKVFHYSDIEKWPKIKRGSWESDGMPGLAPVLRVGAMHHGARATGGVFAFTTPDPEEWIDNKDFSNAWKRLCDNVGVLLVEIEVDSKDPGAFVFDWGHIEGFLNPTETTPEKYRHDTRLEAETAYFETRVPLGVYLEKQDDFDFALPEVVLTEHIPLERVGISPRQPFIEEMLETNKGRYSREEITHKLEMAPELKKWLEGYRERKALDERGMRMR